MMVLLAAAALQGQPNASSCSVAYAIEAGRRLTALGLSRPVDPSKLTRTQLDQMLSPDLDHFLTEGRTWTAIAFSQNQTWASAIGAAYHQLSGSPDEQAATFRSCSQVQAADQEPPFREPATPAPRDREQCAAEDAAVHTEIRQRATADMIQAHALTAMSAIEDGALTCRSLDEARYVWMEIGAAAAAAVANEQGLATVK